MELRKNSRSFTRSVGLYFQDLDMTLFATVVAVSLFGVLNMYGIAGWGPVLFKQAVFVVIGVAMMLLFSFFNYRYFKNYSFPVLFFYFLSLFLLALTFYSRSIRGVNSWIILGNFTFEPSELVKLVLIVLLAKYFSQKHVHINEFKHVVVPTLYFLIPAGIIMAQPDLGSAIIISLIWAGIIMAAGINKKHLFLIVILGLVFSYAGWLFALKPYQKVRITSFLDPYSDPRGSGYNLIQSKIAIGSGYWFGNGLGKGSQTSLGFLPEPYNDFVFAAASEQFGFLGMAAVMAGILVIISRILRVGKMTDSNFGKIFAVGLAIFIFAHALIGAAVNVGLMPVTGIPFPFLSYGGSYLISVMIGLGILQSIKRYG